MKKTTFFLLVSVFLATGFHLNAQTTITLAVGQSYTLPAPSQPNATVYSAAWSSNSTDVSVQSLAGFQARITVVNAFTSNVRVECHYAYSWTDLQGYPHTASNYCYYLVECSSGGGGGGGGGTGNESGVSLTPTSMSIELHGSSPNYIGACALPAGSTTTFTWTSSDPTVATVRLYSQNSNCENGYVEAHSVGTCYITVRTANGYTSQCYVTVTDNSGWGGSTGCDPIGVPYFENFNECEVGANGTFPDCWNTFSSGERRPGVYSSPSDRSPDNSNFMSMYSFFDDGNVQMAVLPEFTTPIRDLSMSFYYLMDNGADGLTSFSVGYLTGDGNSSTFHSVETIDYSRFIRTDTISFSNVPATAERIAIRWECYQAYYGVYIDNVNVYLTPTSPNDSCEALDVPYFECFNSTPAVNYNAEGGRLPNCWEGYSNGTSEVYFPHVTDSRSSYHYSPDGSSSLTMTSGGSTYGSTKMVVLPEFTTAIRDLSVSFYYRTESVNGTFTVGYVTGSDYENTYHAVDTISNTTTITLDTVDFSIAPETASRIAFKWDCNGSYYSVGIDDVSVFSTIPVVPVENYTVTVMPNHSEMGTIYGGGTYASGEMATLTPSPYYGYRFVCWNDYNTDNPRYITVTQDTILIAEFAAATEGIDEITMENICVSSSYGNIHIEGGDGETVLVYDMMGRCIINIPKLSLGELGYDISVPNGVYLVKVGSLSSRKIVVIK